VLALAAVLAAGLEVLWLTGTLHWRAPQPAPRAAAAAAPTKPAPAAAVPADRSHAYASAWLSAHPATDAPGISGRNAVVVDLERRLVLYEKDARQRVPVASLAKMVTAMVALDAARPDRLIQVPAAATQVEANHMGLSAGERLTLRELLYGLLLDSGNDAAEAIAEGTLGRAAFIEAMNARVRGLGLQDTHFENPSGIDAANQYSTAYDMAVVAGTLLDAYPDVRAIVGSQEQTLPSQAGHKWFRPYNLNRLVWTYPGAVGIKPGFTDSAQYTLAGAAVRDGRTIIAVVLGSQRHFTDGAALLDYGFKRAALP
jgi:serine-type D-Ala-D-Ala carboxypeptidase (penicillin-binding protein 5/6)